MNDKHFIVSTIGFVVKGMKGCLVSNITTGHSEYYFCHFYSFLGTVQGQDCGIENFPRREQFLLNDLKAIDFQSPNTAISVGYLFIAPQLKFNCHGSISSWHALTTFNTADTALDVLFHDITFQLWRPSAEDNRLYSFIGSNIAKYNGNEIRARRTILDGRQFFNLTSTPSAQDRLQFQPGDVVGWYIHTTVQAIDQPLTIIYRHATSDDENAVDLFSTVISDVDYATTPPSCDMAVCSTNTTHIPSVIPYITFEYGKLRQPAFYSKTHISPQYFFFFFF